MLTSMWISTIYRNNLFNLFFKVAITFSISISFFSARAEEIYGYVQSSTEGIPIVGASVRLEGTNYGAVTNSFGFFFMKKVPKGKYTLVITYLGYNSLRTQIEVPLKDTLRFSLSPKAIEFSEVLVSASKKLQLVQEVPVSVSIVNSNVFTQRNYLRLDEALRYVTGVIINKDNINIRGSSGFSFGLGSRVAYMIDGMSFLSGENLDAKYDIIPNGMIERIEVVKGAGSALYGSGAIGGVVNIITKEPSKDLKLTIISQGGIYTKPKYEQWVYSSKLSTKSLLNAYFSKDFDLFKFSISANLINDESYRKYDKSFRYNVFAKLSKDLRNYGKISAFLFNASDRRDDWVYWHSLDSATIPPPNTDFSRKLTSAKRGYGLEGVFLLGGRTFANVRNSLYNTNLSMNIAETHPEYRRTNAYSAFTELQLNTHFDNNILLTEGLSLTHNWVNSNNYGNVKQTWFSCYSQIEFQNLYNFTLNLGARIDWEKSDSSSPILEISPKFGLTYLLEKSKSIRFSVGRGFRSPSLAERFAALKFSGFEVKPNHGLKSEKNWSFEVGSFLEFEDFVFPFQIDFSLFYSRYKDLIEPSFDTREINPVIKFQNVTNAQIAGAEFSWKSLIFKRIPFTFGLSYIEPKDIDSNTYLKYRSKWNLISSIVLPLSPLEIVLDFRYISKMLDIDNSLRLQVKDYNARAPIYVVDLAANFDLNHFSLPVKVTVSAQNLLDYYYVEMVGNLAPTRLISLRLQYSPY